MQEKREREESLVTPVKEEKVFNNRISCLAQKQQSHPPSLLERWKQKMKRRIYAVLNPRKLFDRTRIFSILIYEWGLEGKKKGVHKVERLPPIVDSTKEDTTAKRPAIETPTTFTTADKSTEETLSVEKSATEKKLLSSITIEGNMYQRIFSFFFSGIFAKYRLNFFFWTLGWF